MVKNVNIVGTLLYITLKVSENNVPISFLYKNGNYWKTRHHKCEMSTTHLQNKIPFGSFQAECLHIYNLHIQMDKLIRGVLGLFLGLRSLFFNSCSIFFCYSGNSLQCYRKHIESQKCSRFHWFYSKGNLMCIKDYYNFLLYTETNCKILT